MRKWIILGLVPVVAGVIGCSTQKDPARPPATPLAADNGGPSSSYILQREPVPITAQMAGAVGVVRVVVTDRGFEPGQILAKKGERVKVYLQNKGAKPHNLVIPRFHIATSAMLPGGENYIEFTAGERGSWEFFSDAPGVAEEGLAGRLKVE